MVKILHEDLHTMIDLLLVEIRNHLNGQEVSVFSLSKISKTIVDKSVDDSGSLFRGSVHQASLDNSAPVVLCGNLKSIKAL